MERPTSRQQRWTRYAERIANAYGVVLLFVVLTYVVTSLASYRGWSTVPVTALGATTGALALASSDVAPPRVRLAFATAVLATLLAALYALGAGRGFLATAALIQGLLLLIASG